MSEYNDNRDDVPPVPELHVEVCEGGDPVAPPEPSLPPDEMFHELKEPEVISCSPEGLGFKPETGGFMPAPNVYEVSPTPFDEAKEVNEELPRLKGEINPEPIKEKIDIPEDVGSGWGFSDNQVVEKKQIEGVVDHNPIDAPLYDTDPIISGGEDNEAKPVLTRGETLNPVDDSGEGHSPISDKSGYFKNPEKIVDDGDRSHVLPDKHDDFGWGLKPIHKEQVEMQPEPFGVDHEVIERPEVMPDKDLVGVMPSPLSPTEDVGHDYLPSLDVSKKDSVEEIQEKIVEFRKIYEQAQEKVSHEITETVQELQKFEEANISQRDSALKSIEQLKIKAEESKIELSKLPDQGGLRIDLQAPRLQYEQAIVREETRQDQFAKQINELKENLNELSRYQTDLNKEYNEEYAVAKKLLIEKGAMPFEEKRVEAVSAFQNQNTDATTKGPAEGVMKKKVS